jgi:hypothetical protein
MTGKAWKTVIEAEIAKQPSRLLKSTIETAECRVDRIELAVEMDSKWIQTSRGLKKYRQDSV